MQSSSKSLPGELLIEERGQIRLTRDAPGIGMNPLRYRDDAAYAEQFRELLQRATQRTCRSHEGVGIMLSSGMDSGPAAYFASTYLASAASLLRLIPGLYQAFPLRTKVYR